MGPLPIPFSEPIPGTEASSKLSSPSLDPTSNSSATSSLSNHPGGIEKTYHQDSPYFKIEPMNLVTAWAALDDVTLENGCLYVVPGSHLEGALDHSEPWMVGDRKDMKIPDSAIDRSKETPIALKAGDCSFPPQSHPPPAPVPTIRPTSDAATRPIFMSSHSRWTGDPNEKPDYPLLLGAEFEGCV